MTKRAAFTKADLARAVRVADELGKVALWTAAGIRAYLAELREAAAFHPLE